MKPNRPLNPQRIKFMGRIRGPFFKQALDEFEANLVEEVILTLPISRYFEPDDEGDLATVHTSIVSAHETLVEIDALYIRLTYISRGIIDRHI